MTPDSLVIRHYIFRAAKLWLIARMALSALIVLAGDNPLRLSFAAIIATIILVSFLGLVEVRRNREQSLLGNLGVSSQTVITMLSAPAVFGEALLWLLGQATE